MAAPPLPRVPSQMGLDRGPPPPGTATLWGRCYLDGVALPLLDQVEEIGVASHGLSWLQNKGVGATYGFYSGYP